MAHSSQDQAISSSARGKCFVSTAPVASLSFDSRPTVTARRLHRPWRSPLHRIAVRVDEETRSVTSRPAPRTLWLRGTLFLALGIGLPVAVLGPAERSSWITIPVLLVTAATAAWLAAGLRRGWEIDDRGIRLGTGRRRPTALPWGEVAALRVEEHSDGATLVAERRNGGRLEVGRTEEAAELEGALAAARALGLVPAHVDVEQGTANGQLPGA